MIDENDKNIQKRTLKNSYTLMIICDTTRNTPPINNALLKDRLLTTNISYETKPISIGDMTILKESEI